MTSAVVLLKVEGMSCGGCVRSVGAIAKKVLGEGVAVDVRLEEGEAELSAVAPEDISEEQVERVIEALQARGFPASAR